MNDVSSATSAWAAPEAVAALRAQPHFAESMRASAAGMLAMYRGGRLVNWLIDDRGQLLFSYYALYLHFTREAGDPTSGLTPTRLKSICTERGICSAGRVTAMLHLLRWAGFITPDTNIADRRRRPFLATPRFVELLHARWRLHFAAMAPLLPDGEDLRHALDDPAFLRAFVIAMESAFRTGFRFTNDPQLHRIIDRNAGILIMASLVAGGAADDTVPPSHPVPVSVSALARCFAVSRVHVMGLLDEAAAAGVLMRGQAEQNHVLVLPPLADELRDFFARMFLCFAACARVALKELSTE